jgi:hypothetical protein
MAVLLPAILEQACLSRPGKSIQLLEPTCKSLEFVVWETEEEEKKK